jgi:hypothetical protein
MDSKTTIAATALAISIISLIITLLSQRRIRLESIIEGLRGDRRSVTYSALYIRFANLFSRHRFRQSIIASLLLSWNFETSDRARAAILASLIKAKKIYGNDFDQVTNDLKAMFTSYEKAVEKGDISRGQGRLDDVLKSIEKAESVS